MNDTYDNIARFYDWVAGWTLASLRRGVAQMAAQSGARSVIDIGCGTGLQLLELKRQGLRAIGVDNSKAMLDVAQKRLGEGTEADLALASGAALPFAAGEFDLSMLTLVLHESDDEPFALLDEALRVAPRAYVLDWGLTERNLDYPVHAGIRVVERMAGRRHYAAYKDYLHRGALEGLILRYTRERSVQITLREHMFFNSIIMMQLEKK